MSLQRLLESGWFLRIILVVNIVGAIVVALMFSQIDSVVNVELYKYHLQFNAIWYNAYEGSLHLAYVFLGLPLALSLIGLGAGFRNHRKPIPEMRAKLDVVPPKMLVVEPTGQERNVSTQVKASQNKVEPDPRANKPQLQDLKPKDNSNGRDPGNTLIISCPSCKKVFSRPLVMLDFSAGKTRLVNVCPYCNQTLGEAAAQEEKNMNKNIHVATMDESIKQVEK